MENKKERSTINTLYVMLIISTIAAFMPMMSAMLLSFALIIVVLISAYYYQAKDTQDGLMHNHMTYMIGTVWIGTGFIAIGIMAAGLWVYSKGDHSIIHNAIDNITSGVMMYDEHAITAVTYDYIRANQTLMIKASLLCVGPAMLYFVYRVANGFSRSLRGYRIANPKSWL